MAHADNLFNSILRSARGNKCVAFTYMPDFCEENQPWDASMMKDWRDARIKGISETVREAPWKYFLATPLNGTTFSGHSTKTTLGNTLRSIMYMYFYIYKSGLPWNWATFHIDYPVEASGDDTVAYAKDEQTAKKIADSIERLTLRDTYRDNNRAGLGQVVKEVLITPWEDQEFCSKWVFSEGPVDTITMCRDVRKILFSRNVYTGSNTAIRNNPSIHAEAIYRGFESEKVSRIIEDILYMRWRRQSTHGHLTADDILCDATDRYKYKFTDED